MKKNDMYHRWSKIFITFIVMLLLTALSCIISLKISKMEEQECWNKLDNNIEQAIHEIEFDIKSNGELLECVADIISEQDFIESDAVQKIIDGYKSKEIITNIALLLPGDRVMLPEEPIKSTDGIISFEKESALGKHVSDKSISILNKNEPVIRNFVPIIKDGKTQAILYSAINLEKMSENIEFHAYDNKSALYIADGKTGDYIMDTWHKKLGNVEDSAESKLKEGYSHEKMKNDLYEGKSGHCIFVSETTGENLYFYYKPMSINKWMMGISVSENTAFERIKTINKILIFFIATEIILLTAYFIYILKTTKKELAEKQKMAERDSLTGLLNRNSYEWNIHVYADSCKNNLTCIYIDVNGLHEINNTKGHAAGDKMLKVVADSIHNCFNDRDVYRIGGDEFVVFVRDSNLEDIQKKLNEINENIQKNSYHISIGVCSQNIPIDIDKTIKTAETNMYDSKRKYYEQEGNDRRSRR
ncbi:MAG: diguanylate cyclase domain-containing protein [Acutalibacteraceae bacterium]